MKVPDLCVDDGLLARCREAVKCGRDALVVGHNVPFDFRMLGNECRKFGYALDSNVYINFGIDDAAHESMKFDIIITVESRVGLCAAWTAEV